MRTHPVAAPHAATTAADGRHAAAAMARARRAASLDLLLGGGVAAAGLTLAVASLFAPVGGPEELLLRVHGTGLLGLLAVVWGAALVEAAALRWAAAAAPKGVPALIRSGETPRPSSPDWWRRRPNPPP